MPVDHPDNADAGAQLAGRRPPTPRWVKVFAALGLVVLVVLVLLLVVGSGGHGPGQHLGAGQLLEPALGMGGVRTGAS